MNSKDNKNKHTIGPIPIMLTFALLCGACTSSSTNDYSTFITTPRRTVTATEYRLAPPDSIRIVSKRVREINGHSEVIRPDGKITLPLLGSIYIAGKTCEQASAELEELAKSYYEDADVSLRVTGFKSKHIYVFGEVGTAGPYPYDGANTVLETLAIAQPTRLADPANIQVLRPNAQGQLIKRMSVDLNKMIKNGDTQLDAVLEEGDIVYVPANGFAAVGLALQQLLLPLTPAATVVQGPANIEAAGGGRSNYGGGN